MNNWAAFYKASAELFQFLHQSGRLLFGDEEQLKAMFDESIEEQQRFLQIVIQLNEPDDLIIFEGLLVNYKALYAQAIGNTDKAQSNCPRLLDSTVYQMNISINDAYSSTKWMPDGNDYYTGWSCNLSGLNETEIILANEKSLEILNAFKQKGFPAKLKADDSGFIQVIFDVNATHNWLSCEHIQIRKRTGNQYKVHLLRKGIKTERARLGVVVVAPGQDIGVFTPTPRETRKDALFHDNNTKLIEWPIHSEYEFYKRP